VTPQDLLAVAPLIVAALAGVVVLLAGAFGAHRESLHRLAVIGIGLALATLLPARSAVPRDVTTLLRVDGYALLFLTLLLSAVGILIIISLPYLRARRRGEEVYYALLLFASVGMGVLACSNHFASFFLGLETLTVSLYVLLGYLRSERPSLEAAAKYLVLAAMASGLLLFGIALLYAATGTLVLSAVGAAAADLLRGGPAAETSWVIAGSLFLLAGFAFKLALVPFHMWSPDVYQGAPAPITALIATGSKGAVIAVLLRMVAASPAGQAPLAGLLGGLAIVTMLGGNLLALMQTDLKRLLAYSSVAHIGYIFVALATGAPNGGDAVIFYTITYVVTTLGTFGVVAVLSAERGVEADDLAAYRGLGRRRPGLAAVLAVMLLSLAGIPPTGGFLAKFAVLGAAVSAGRNGLAMTMVLASAIAIYYYLRVLVTLYMEPEVAAPSSTEPATDETIAAAPAFTSMAALTALVVVILVIGVWPEPWLRAVGAAMISILGG
jgi:NADH-quinone oxidoreductase subunit N